MLNTNSPLYNKVNLELETQSAKLKREQEKLALEKAKYKIAINKLNKEWYILKYISKEKLTVLMDKVVSMALAGNTECMKMILKLLDNDAKQSLIAIQNTVQNNENKTVTEQKVIMLNNDQSEIDITPPDADTQQG